MILNDKTPLKEIDDALAALKQKIDPILTNAYNSSSQQQDDSNQNDNNNSPKKHEHSGAKQNNNSRE